MTEPAILPKTSALLPTDDAALVLQLRGVAKRYRGVEVLADVSFDVRRGEFVSILGPSGSGKTTCLRLVAGLDRPDHGEIWLDGVLVASASDSRAFVPSHRRNVGLVFQSYALWPHLTVQDNVAYPLLARGVSRTAARQRAREFLELVGLAGQVGDARRLSAADSSSASHSPGRSSTSLRSCCSTSR